MMGRGFGGGMMFIWILLLIGIVVFLTRSSGRPDARVPDSRGDHPDALALLKIRYARGEIDRDEYFAKRQDLDA